MAQVVNDRDLYLQAAPERTVTVTLPVNIIIPGFIGIELAAQSNFFRIPNEGSAQPAAIQIDAVLKHVVGTVTWSVIEGDATLQGVLGGSSLSRILTPINMASDFIVIQASVTDAKSGVAYFARMSFSKIRDGAPGERGMASVFWNVVTPGWSNQAALSALASRGFTSARIGDMVTQQYINSAGVPEWVETRFYDGTNWIFTREIVNGNLLVRGTVGANAMAANSITAENAALANASIRRAKIGVAEIDTLLLAGETATIARSAYNAAALQLNVGYQQVIQSLPAFVSKGGRVVINFGHIILPMFGGGGHSGVTYRLRRNAVTIFQFEGHIAQTPPITDLPGAGSTVTYDMTYEATGGDVNMESFYRGMFSLEATR